MLRETVQDMFITPLYQQHASHTLASRAYGPQPPVLRKTHTPTILSGPEILRVRSPSIIHDSWQIVGPFPILKALSHRSSWVLLSSGAVELFSANERQLPGRRRSVRRR